MNEIKIDSEIKRGIITIESYNALLGAEIYGTATPMQWLIGRLAVIQNTVKSGVRIKYETEYDVGDIKSEKEYLDWCEKNFPSAYKFIK